MVHIHAFSGDEDCIWLEAEIDGRKQLLGMFHRTSDFTSCFLIEVPAEARLAEVEAEIKTLKAQVEELKVLNDG